MTESNEIGLWFSGSAGWLDKESLSIIFYLEPKLAEVDAIERVKASVAKSNIKWLVPIDDIWILKTDVLRAKFEALKNYQWLNGNLAIYPEINQESLVQGDATTQHTTVTFSVGEV